MSMTLTPAMSQLAGSKVEILIGCTNLADLDEFTKSDPMCVLFVKQFGQWKEYGRSEAIRNTLNPKFVESFVIEFEPNMTQQLMFSVYDIDSRSLDLKDHDFVGTTEESLLNLIDENKLMKTTNKNLRVPGDPRTRGIISITTEIMKESKNKVSIHAGGHKLDKKGMFSMNKFEHNQSTVGASSSVSPDPSSKCIEPDTYLEISRSIDSVSYHPVYRTEVVYKSTHPRWRPFELSVQKLCNTDWDRNLQFSCWHYSGTDYHLIGRKNTSLREMYKMEKMGNYKEVYLSSPKKEKSSKKKTLSGHLRFFQFRVDMQYSMLDFIRGGMQLNLILAIDFTASNGNIDEDLCLHCITDARENQYLDVLETLGAMIAQYSFDQKVALFGFGANWKDRDRGVSHCFPLTRDRSNIHVKGIKNVINKYEEAIPELRFSGPTRLSPIIEKAAALAERENTSQERQVYTVLLIITDGVINDIDKAVRRLIAISHLPLSVIFVGIGPADFSLMEQFHVGIDCPLKDEKRGDVAVRTNTYFVAFRKDNIDTGGNTALAREAMAALSTQVLQYMKKNNLTPKPAASHYDEKILSNALDFESENNSTQLKKSESRSSLLTVKSIGPSCPTCGATVEVGNQLYNKVLNVS